MDDTENDATLGRAGAERPASGKGRARKAGPRLDEPSLLRFAHWYLERWAASEHTLRRALARRVARAVREDGADAATGASLIDVVLSTVTRQGLVRDDLYADARAGRLARRGTARRRIAEDLSSRGIAGDTIAEALETLPGDDLTAALAYARRRRLGPFRVGGDPASHRQRDLAALARAGFDRSTAEAVLAHGIVEDGSSA
ncbi:MAG: hypothetical protein EAZ99_11200 [Alphaproteobacteria bacterium]|nr:RecX family transcriptional regulator [Alphaproteobacteria bacterium]TAD89020.1 MAG: hypothetical protein EAZ99_11200 [Alphaproteobacteria bacterium]